MDYIKRKFLSGLLIAAIVFPIAFIGGAHLSLVSAKEKDGLETKSDDLFDDLKVFTDVLAIVQRDYVREVPASKLVEGAIKGLLAQLDPHSGYLDPDFYSDLQVQTKGEFGGLGIEITIKDGLLVVVSPMEGSPAEKAGVQPGDTIVKIEDKYTKEYSLVDAVKKLRGPKGSSVKIAIHRKGRKDLVEVVLTRDNIEVKSVRSKYLGDGFGLVRINQFMEKTSDDIKTALKNIAKASPDNQIRGLVLDVRNNPGGLLTQAIKVCDLFLKSGIIVYTDGRVEAQKQKFFAHERDTEPDYPMVVLVNGGSASASEIVAGALKDHGRAVILGTQTFGKGSVQTITPLSNGGAITLTTALYYTKSGKSLQGTGVKPDIDMPVKDEDSDDSKEAKAENDNTTDSNLLRERDLPGAIENPSGADKKTPLQKINKTPTIRGDLSNSNIENISLADLLKKDAQLVRALDLLKTFNIFGAPKPGESIADNASTPPVNQ